MKKLITITVALYFIQSSVPAFGREERFSVMSNGERVGTLEVRGSGNDVDIDYAVSNNGRGPKVREKLSLDANGYPRDWKITGSSLMGGDVNESMTVTNGTLRWTSQADKGDIRSPSARLYIGNDASPWAYGLYARLLLKTSAGTMPVLPSGTISLKKVRPVTLGKGGQQRKLQVYALSGVTLTPKFIALDSKNELFAVLDDGLLVRASHEQHYEELRRLTETLASDYASALQEKLAHRYDGLVHIRNVHVFDPSSGRRSAPMNVVIHKGEITSITNDAGAVSPGDQVIDGEGGTLVAGLHDMHSHSTIWSGLFYIAAGVTTTRDMGSENATLARLIDATAAGKIAGPDIVRAGLLEGRSAFSARTGMLPESPEQAREYVRWYADRGYRYIKIYNSMNPQWVPQIAAEAHRLGLGVLGHVPAFSTPEQMLEAGYDELTHINQLMLGWVLKPGEDTRTPLRLTALARAAELNLDSEAVRRTLALMKQKRAGLDTTLSIVEQLMLSRTGEVAEGAAAYLGHLPIGYQRYRKRSFVKFQDEADQERYVAAFDKVLDTVARMHRQGIPLWPGTDDPTGFLLHRELELYVKAGISPAETLRMATADCARYMGRDQNHGSIERGKRADFFLVPGDPTADLGQLHKIRMVVKGQSIYYPAEIYSALNIEPFVSAPRVSRH